MRRGCSLHRKKLNRANYPASRPNFRPSTVTFVARPLPRAHTDDFLAEDRSNNIPPTSLTAIFHRLGDP